MEPGFKQDGGVVNKTRGIEPLCPWLNHPRKTIIEVEVLMVTAAALLLQQPILGYCKRRWHNSIVTGYLSLCNTLMPSLIIYILSIMQSSAIKNSMYPTWFAFLLMASMGTTVVHQYDFHGSFYNKYMQMIVEIGRYCFYLVIMVLLLVPKSTWKVKWELKDPKAVTSSSQYVLLLVEIILLTKLSESLGLFVLGYFKRPITLVAGRMDNPSDSESMNGYNYVVLEKDIMSVDRLYLWGPWGGKICKSHKYIITIDQIWDFFGNSGSGEALKDLCLSYAMFLQLLARRYFRVVCPEESPDKTLHFFFKELLPSEGEFRRAFRIIEVELGFCYDFFFTKYHYTFLSMETPLLSWILFICFLSKIILIIIVGVFTLTKSLVIEAKNPIIEVENKGPEYIITLLALGVALTVELLQFSIYLASDWVQVSLACRYATKNCCTANAFIGKAAGLLRRHFVSKLRNEIGQRSVIFKWKLSAEVSETVKRAIARLLISAYGSQTNEGTSQNQMFDWTFEDHSQLEVILIWHIATEYCDVSDDHRDGTSARDERGVAVNLSRYCAYLIECVPELLPYDEVDIKELVEKVKREGLSLKKVEEEQELSRDASSEVQGTQPPEYLNYLSYEAMKNLDVTEVTNNTFKKGIKLGKQLESGSIPDGAQHWKVMADFWAETIVYVARSPCTVTQHMQHLENGGEFLTHIWALISHAGILNIDRDNKYPAWCFFRTRAPYVQATQEANAASGHSEEEILVLYD